MITQVNNYQTNISYQGLKLKAPKEVLQKTKTSIQQCNLKNKLKDCFTKVKNEINDLDEESKDLLFKTIVLGTVLVTFIGIVIHYISRFMENVNNLFN